MDTRPVNNHNGWNENASASGNINVDFGLPYDILVKYVSKQLNKEDEKEVEEYIVSHPEEQAVLESIRLMYESGEKPEEINFTPNLQEVHAKLEMRELLKTSSQTDGATKFEGISNIYSANIGEAAFFSNFKKQLLKKRTLEEAYKYICDMLKLVLNCRSASIYLYGQVGILERKYIAGYYRKLEPPVETFRNGQGYVGKAVGTKEKYGEMLYCNDVKKIAEIKKEDPDLERYVENYRDSLYLQHGVNEEINHLIVTPLNAFRRSLGVLRVINKLDENQKGLALGGFTEEDRKKIQRIAELGAIALSYLKLEKRENVLNNIQNLLDEYGSKKVFDKICESLINESTLYGGCIIRTVDPKNRILEVRGSSVKNLERQMLKIKVEEGFTGTTFYSDSHKIIQNIHKRGENYLFKDWAQKNDMVSVICFPLKSLDGNIKYGTLCVYTKFNFLFGQDDIKYLESFANQVARIIESIQDEKEQRLLRKLSESLIKKSDYEEVMKDISRNLPQITGFDRCRFLLKEGNKFRMISKDSPRWSNISLDNKIGRKILNNPSKIFQFYDVSGEEDLIEVKKYLENVRALVLIPISNSKKELYGLIALVSLINREVHIKEEMKFKIVLNLISKLNSDLLATICNLFSAAIEKRKEREAKEKAQNHLIEERYLLRTLVDNVSDLIYCKDTLHRFTLANRAQIEVLGAQSLEEVLGKTDLDFFEQEDAENYHKPELDLFSGKRSIIHKEERVVNQTNGSVKTYSTIKTVHRNSLGKIIGLFGIGRDISELKNRVLRLVQQNVVSKNTAEVIKNRYEEYKHSVRVQCERLISEYQHDPRICLYARLISADFFVDTELPARYLSNLSLKSSQAVNDTLDSVFEDEFKDFVSFIPEALSETASIKINITAEKQRSFRLDKRQIQDIILSLVKNSLKYKLPNSRPTINIEVRGKYLSIKTDCQRNPGDIKKLKKAVAAIEYQNQGSSLFGIDKYFKENYKENIEIEYANKEFIVNLPLIMN